MAEMDGDGNGSVDLDEFETWFNQLKAHEACTGAEPGRPYSCTEDSWGSLSDSQLAT
jgi:hypothetical protein